MGAFAELLGESLVSSDGPVKTEEVLKGKIVGLYFSAHWCPPCRGFTPQLAGYYKEDLKAKGLEIVFLSGDSDEAAFKDYFGEMPWLALPYSERALKDKLSKKYKVRGIPSFVILDQDGETVTTDGRSKVSDDPKGEDFPWKSKPLSELLSEVAFVDKGGKDVKLEEIEKPYLGLYFSAHWCPPCRGFTPELAKRYTKLNENGLEIVFVSSDRDESSFKEYFGEMPWLALPYAERKVKAELSGALGVGGIPCLAILKKADCSVVTTNGRSAVDSDPEGLKLPWYPEPVVDLTKDCEGIDESVSFAALIEELSDENKEKVEICLKDTAREIKAEGKDDEDGVLFFIGKKNEGMVSRLRDFCELSGSSDPVLLLLNIGESEHCPLDVVGGKDGFAENCTTKFMKECLAKYRRGELTMKSSSNS